ncbi:hypothetical protein [Salipiger mucosus]|uniref:Uncharacterized protein n=1 Tax=Salipiger mucosus DSM 16094 TaxID=1123237 RepID=S9QWT5_9RHOB|nr:hypothetical protein [Salipiger mucosus]EPX84042.1 hypothetical protein Salmuc_01817 [Salipiger mucosus DSM 16094]
MKCAVITPIGPGHAELYQTQCLASIRAAAAYSTGPFDEIIPFGMDDTAGTYGRSARRNSAIQEASRAGVEWVFFLDADDVLAPNAFEAFGDIMKSEPDLDAVWGLICNYDQQGEPVLREGQVVSLNSREEFLGVKPYFSIQIGAFMKTECVARFGFDVDLNAGEDFKLYYQMWETFRCAKRPAIFFINRIGQHSSGPRSATGRDWVETVHRQWYEQIRNAAAVASLPHGSDEGEPLHAPISNPDDPIQAVHTECEFFARPALDALKDRFGKDRPLRVLQVGADRGNNLLYFDYHMTLDRLMLVEPDAEAAGIVTDTARINRSDGRLDTGGIGACWEDLPGLLYTQSVDLITINQPGHEVEILESLAAEISAQRPLVWVEMARGNVMPVIQHLSRAHRYRPCGNFGNASTTSYFFSSQ